MNFLMVIMASGIARGRVRTTTTTESRKMANILRVIGWQRHAALVYRLLLWYWASMLRLMTPVKTSYLLTSVTWPYRGLKCAVHRGHVFFVGDRWPSTGFRLDRGLMDRGLMLTCWKPGRIVRKPANGSLFPRPIPTIQMNRGSLKLSAIAWRPGIKWQKSPSSARKSPRYCSTKTFFFLRGSENISDV